MHKYPVGRKQQAANVAARTEIYTKQSCLPVPLTGVCRSEVRWVNVRVNSVAERHTRMLSLEKCGVAVVANWGCSSDGLSRAACTGERMGDRREKE